MARSGLHSRIRAATAAMLHWDGSDRQIVHGMAWTAAFLLGAKLVTAVKEMVVAAHFGVGTTVDAYMLVTSVALWPVVVAMSVFTLIVLPLHIQLLARDPESAARLQRGMLGWMAVVGLALTALLWLATPPLIVWLTPPEAVALRAQALAMLPGMLCAIAPGILAGLFSAWIMAGGRHVNTLLDGVPALTLLVLLLAWPVPSAMLLAWGTALGICAQLAAAAFVLARGGKLLRPALRTSFAGWPALAGGAGLALFASVLNSASGVVEQFIGAQLGTGALSALGYAARIVALCTGLGALAVTRAVLPVFSVHAQTGDAAQAWPLVQRWVARMALLGTALMATVYLLAPWIIGLLFERGAFGAQDVAEVAAVLRGASLQFPIFFAAHVLWAYAASQRRYRLIFESALVLCIVRPLVGWWWAQLGGAPGLAASMAAAYAASGLLLGWRLYPRIARPARRAAP